jgi:hypothetical protein
MKNFWTKIEEQNKVISILDNAGFKFQSKHLGEESKKAYTKSNGSGQVRLYVTNDADVSLFEGLNMSVVKQDRGYDMPEFSVFQIEF